MTFHSMTCRSMTCRSRCLGRLLVGALLRLARLLPGLRGVVGHVPPLPLQDEGGRAEEPSHGASALLARREGSGRDPLLFLECPAALQALVLVCRHKRKRYMGLSQSVKAPQPVAPLAGSDTHADAVRGMRLVGSLSAHGFPEAPGPGNLRARTRATCRTVRPRWRSGLSAKPWPSTGPSPPTTTRSGCCSWTRRQPDLAAESFQRAVSSGSRLRGRLPESWHCACGDGPLAGRCTGLSTGSLAAHPRGRLVTHQNLGLALFHLRAVP